MIRVNPSGWTRKTDQAYDGHIGNDWVALAARMMATSESDCRDVAIDAMVTLGFLWWRRRDEQRRNEGSAFRAGAPFDERSHDVARRIPSLRTSGPRGCS